MCVCHRGATKSLTGEGHLKGRGTLSRRGEREGGGEAERNESEREHGRSVSCRLSCRKTAGRESERCVLLFKRLYTCLSKLPRANMTEDPCALWARSEPRRYVPRVDSIPPVVVGRTHVRSCNVSERAKDTRWRDKPTSHVVFRNLVPSDIIRIDVGTVDASNRKLCITDFHSSAATCTAIEWSRSV